MESKIKDITKYLIGLNKFIWRIAELGLAIAVAGLVLFLILGEESGWFPASVAENFINLTASIGGEGLTALLAAAVFILITKSLLNKNN